MAFAHSAHSIMPMAGLKQMLDKMKEDEEEEKKNADPEEEELKKTVKKRKRPKLDKAAFQEMLVSPNGLQRIYSDFGEIKFKGKGREAEDLALLMRRYEEWAYKLVPVMAFDDVIQKVEAVGNTYFVHQALEKLRDLEREKKDPRMQEELAQREAAAKESKDAAAEKQPEPAAAGESGQANAAASAATAPAPGPAPQQDDDDEGFSDPEAFGFDPADDFEAEEDIGAEYVDDDAFEEEARPKSPPPAFNQELQDRIARNKQLAMERLAATKAAAAAMAAAAAQTANAEAGEQQDSVREAEQKHEEQTAVAAPSAAEPDAARNKQLAMERLAATRAAAAAPTANVEAGEQQDSVREAEQVQEEQTPVAAPCTEPDAARNKQLAMERLAATRAAAAAQTATKEAGEQLASARTIAQVQDEEAGSGGGGEEGTVVSGDASTAKDAGGMECGDDGGSVLAQGQGDNALDAAGQRGGEAEQPVTVAIGSSEDAAMEVEPAEEGLQQSSEAIADGEAGDETDDESDGEGAGAAAAPENDSGAGPAPEHGAEIAVVESCVAEESSSPTKEQPRKLTLREQLLGSKASRTSPPPEVERDDATDEDAMQKDEVGLLQAEELTAAAEEPMGEPVEEQRECGLGEERDEYADPNAASPEDAGVQAAEACSLSRGIGESEQLEHPGSMTGAAEDAADPADEVDELELVEDFI